MDAYTPALARAITGCEEVVTALRWRREQQRLSVSVQGRLAEAVESAEAGDPGGSRSPALFKGQPDRAPSVRPHEPGLSRLIFHTLETAKHDIGKTETTTGLRVIVGGLDKVYGTGRKDMADFKQTMKVVSDEVLPK